MYKVSLRSSLDTRWPILCSIVVGNEIDSMEWYSNRHIDRSPFFEQIKDKTQLGWWKGFFYDLTSPFPLPLPVISPVDCLRGCFHIQQSWYTRPSFFEILLDRHLISSHSLVSGWKTKYLSKPRSEMKLSVIIYFFLVFLIASFAIATTIRKQFGRFLKLTQTTDVLHTPIIPTTPKIIQ